jgi:hypothetical protein
MTNKIVLRSIEQFMAGYKPAYRSIMPLFLGNAQQYSVEAGKIDFKRAETVGDIRSKMIGPKDTEMHQIHSKEGTKTFKKYFFGAQYIQSSLQDTQGYEDVVAQVLDEHNKQSDELFLTGEGTSNGTQQNNGLFYSSDANYVTNSSYEVQKDANGEHLSDLYAKVMELMQTADQIDGRKLIMFYGANVVGKVNGMFQLTSQPFRSVLQGALPAGASQAVMPSAITPASSHGLIIVNLDQVKLHYTLLPAIKGQGVNEEKMYAWTNFLMGSSMLEVLASGAVTRQPLTFEA